MCSVSVKVNKVSYWSSASTPVKVDGDIWEDCAYSVDLSGHCDILLDIDGNTYACIALWHRDPLELLWRV